MSEVAAAPVHDDWERLTQVNKAEKVMDYLNRLTGQKFQALNPSGKPTSNTKLIICRLKEGYSKADFRKVIYTQNREWGGDEKMDKYLRPSTLFRKSNFENYLAAGDPDSAQQIERRELAGQPDPREALKDFLRSWMDRGKSWGYEMPDTPQMAADWWINTMQEPCGGNEVMRKMTKKFAKSSGDYTWQYPYLDRLLYTVRKYLMMSREDQVVIVGCIDEKVPWRGDDIDFFYNHEHSVYNETMKMRETDPTEYRQTAINYISGRS